MEYFRLIRNKLEENLFQGRVLILYGARRVGKTTLVQEIFKKYPRSKYFDFEDPQERALFSDAGVDRLKLILQGYDLAVFDEAQKFGQIGQLLKLIHDHLPEVQVIATGSSSFDLANNLNEPLTGRKWEFKLFPLSVSEISKNKDASYLLKNLEEFLVYGTYPAVMDVGLNQKQQVLKELTKSYLFKDIFSLQDVRDPESLEKLVQLLAFQVGQQVSFHELGTQLKIKQETVAKYIRLLEMSFVIFRLPSFSRNLRREISKSRKIYFYDLGLRNALINNFNPLSLRNDHGALWENFCILERMKYLEYKQETANYYFWRNYQKQEIDYIEEASGVLHAFEFKWTDRKKVKLPKSFAEAYPNHTFQAVTPENWLGFLGV